MQAVTIIVMFFTAIFQCHKLQWLLLFSILNCTAACEDDNEVSDHPAAVMLLDTDGWRVVDDDDYGQAVGNPKRKV
jgi:hypothetical protein